ncbi:DUF6175 family protein [Arcticibacterium luteifluviistationis]|uniref:Uncharacterized protein n=1 Tax=Arcticibacterium luteifluviistationis TaxID=1784714 RepID=A0A2Z4GE80_9BACT|nr:DUF6175 family protein [Arcticibacterium luteifluviistationis]AWV99612.1 hypothetical protein DJ013_16110 [Arcticibacterium luteifluviistationis]
MRFKIFLALVLCVASVGFAQDDSQSNLQPTIMVIPFTPKGADLRVNYEHNEWLRVAITKVKDAFDQRGVNTIDFRAKLKQLGNAEALQSEQKTSLKDDIIAISGADIYIEVEANINRSNSGNSVTVLMSAFNAFSGESYANKVSISPKFYTENYEKLIVKAVDEEVPNLLTTISEKFEDIRENGLTITLNGGVSEESDLKMDTEVDDMGSLLSDLLEEYIADNAYKGNYHLQGVSDTRMTFDQIKVPYKDDNGNSFRSTKFALDLRRFLRTNEIKASTTVVGNSITLTIQ